MHALLASRLGRRVRKTKALQALAVKLRLSPNQKNALHYTVLGVIALMFVVEGVTAKDIGFFLLSVLFEVPGKD